MPKLILTIFIALLSIYDIQRGIIGGGVFGGTSAAVSTLYSNLVADYELSETGGGNAFDSHTNAINLSETSGTLDSVTGPGGGPARLFTAADTEYLTAVDNNLFDGGAEVTFGMEAWVNATTLTATNQYIFSKFDAGNNDREWRLYWAGTKFAFGISVDGSAATTVTTLSAAPSTGVWTQLIACHNASANTIVIYQNDDAGASTAAASGVHVGASPIRIGAHGNVTPSIYADSAISRVRFWSSCPDATQRTWLYNSGNSRAYSALSGAP